MALMQVLVKFPEEDLAALDAICGEASKQDFIRALCKGAVDARERWGGPCGLGVVAVAQMPADWVGVAQEPPVALALAPEPS